MSALDKSPSPVSADVFYGRPLTNIEIFYISFRMKAAFLRNKVTIRNQFVKKNCALQSLLYSISLQ